MHEYTKLRKQELESQYPAERKRAWAKLASDISKHGAFHSSDHYLEFIRVGFEYLDSFLKEIFKAEKKALFSADSLPSRIYFSELKDELIRYVEYDVDTIRNEATKIFQMMGQVALNNIYEKIEEYLKITENDIITKTNILPEELTINLNRKKAEGIVEKNKVERLINKVKNHPLLSIIIFIGIIVIVLGAFTDAIKEIINTILSLLSLIKRE